MDHFTIAALMRTEHDSIDRDPRDRRRRDAMTARARRDAARRRALFVERVRSALAHGLRRAAELVEPPRCAESSLAADRT